MPATSPQGCSRTTPSIAVHRRGAARRGTLLILALFACTGWMNAVARTTAPGSRQAPSKVVTSVRHQVAKGENLYRIALSYGVTVDDLCRANGIKDSGQVTVGRVLFVPTAHRAMSRVAAPAKPRKNVTTNLAKSSSASAESRALGPRTSRGGDTSTRSRATPPRTPPASAPMSLAGVITNDELERLTSKVRPSSEEPAETEEVPPSEGGPKAISFNLIPSQEAFSWPVQGGIVRSPFGMRHGRQHAGLDICAASGNPIYAARDGRVSYSGHKYRGYGNVVMLDHGDGFTTVYAHNAANLVREGDDVVRGQIIARVGATGNATGSHCHFEIRNENVSVDPRGYLSENPDEDVIFATGNSPRSATSDLIP